MPCVAVGVALLIALPAVMAFDREFTAAAVMQNQPDLNPAHLDLAVNIVIIDTVTWHAIDVVLSIWFVIKVLQGRRWARVALTAYLVIATAGSLYSAASGTQFLWAVIPGDAIHIVMLALLWVPHPVRDFFAVHRSRRMATAGTGPRSEREVATRLTQHPGASTTRRVPAAHTISSTRAAPGQTGQP